ncbi:MAG TPA: hypothetical protein VD731_07605 [Nitrosopumilaceae archaeon]|nr:hypothetical protein [Nitrosopumilaceae archaeon]
MFNEEFVKEYFKNPFLIWGLILLGFTSLDSALFANLALQAIVIHNLYVPILFGSLIIALSLSLYPIRRSLRKLVEKKETKKEAFMYLTAIFVIFYTEVVYFMIDPMLIFGELDPRVITDKNTWEYAINVKTLVQFIALPAFYAFFFNMIKTRLIKEGYEIHDKFRNNLKFVAAVILTNFGGYFLFIFITILK